MGSVPGGALRWASLTQTPQPSVPLMGLGGKAVDADVLGPHPQPGRVIASAGEAGWA